MTKGTTIQIVKKLMKTDDYITNRLHRSNTFKYVYFIGSKSLQTDIKSSFNWMQAPKNHLNMD